MKIKLSVVLAVVFGFAMIACTPPSGDTQGPMIVKEFDRGAKTLTIRVITHESYAEVTRAKEKFTGKPSEPLLGWSAWSKDEPGQCEIHVVMAQRYDDKEFPTWGHELAHCLYGNYHKAYDEDHAVR